MGSSRFRYTIQGLMVVVAVAALILALVPWSSTPSPFPVSGTVTYRGQPLSTGKVLFVPATTTGVQATGTIVSGKYSLTSFVTNDGALPGTYTVVLVAPSLPAAHQAQASTALRAVVQKSANSINFDVQ